MLRYNKRITTAYSVQPVLKIGCRRFSTPQTRLDFSNLTIQKTATPKTKSPLQSLVFGKEFTDHMFEVDWTKEHGWGKPSIVPYHKLSLEPSAMVFQYSSELFEGMKAYKDNQKRIRTFRPDKNFERLNKSASRLVLPNIETADLLRALKELLKVDADWIPAERGYSLYIRPTMIGTQTTLGVGPSGSAKFFIICSPVGPYYPEGWKPVKLLADDKYVRAWPGGTGNAKLGGNYAPGILPQVEAAKKGYTQILWLFGKEHYITEAGTMNFFIFWKNKNGDTELVTPPLDGTILEGVTRDSILQLARKWGEFKVSERPVTMNELVAAVHEDRVLECFGAGTAAVVSPVQIISYLGKDYQIPLNKNDPTAKIGPTTKRFFDAIQAIQYGEVDHPWSVVVD